MGFSVESFVENPTWEAVNSYRKADLIQIAHQYGITVSTGSTKDVKQAVVTGLVEKQILAEVRHRKMSRPFV